MKMVSKFSGTGTQRYGVNLERNHERVFSKGSKRHEWEWAEEGKYSKSGG